MHPSAATADPTAVQNRPQGLPGSGAESKHGSKAESKGAALKRGGPSTRPLMSSGLERLMEEPPGGANAGRRASARPDLDGRHVALDPDEWQATEFRREGGWTVVYAQYGAKAGVRAHRGVLHPDEHVDTEALRVMVERELGFTYEQVRSVYRQGPLGPDQRELRGRIDARVLALSRSGANVALLGAALGFPVKDNGNCRVMENALARARAEEGATS